MENTTPQGYDLLLAADFDFEELPSRTYAIRENHLTGYFEGHAAMVQTVFCIMNTERYEWQIYDWSYGIETQDLIGRPVEEAIGLLFSRIPEALLQDTRITDVTDLEIRAEKDTVIAVFTVSTIFGDIPFAEGFVFNV